MRCTVVALVLLMACGGGSDPDVSVESDGPYPVGVSATRSTGRDAQTVLPLLVFYPADAAAAMSTVAVADLPSAEHRSDYAGLLTAADSACATRTFLGAVDANIALGEWPLIAFSHCHECTNFSGLSIARRLASHGFIVVAVEHTGNTLWNQLADDGLPLDTSTLETRVRDVDIAVEAVRADPYFTAFIDPARTGVFGHSFGSVTAGLYAQRHAEVGAVFGLAAPMENPLLPGVTITEIQAPLGFLVAREDNSISELGNELIRGNYARAVGPAWKLEVANAGHWSFSDLVGVVPAFAPGCGTGTRQTDGQPFTYLPAETGRAIAAAYVTAFFKATLLDDAGAEGYLATGRFDGVVTAEHR